jgi:hypothetical protein
MWAVIATVFVIRDSCTQSVSAAVSRVAATLVSFVLCLAYLLVLPFHAWALAILVGLSALAVTLAGRPGDAITAGDHHGGDSGIAGYRARRQDACRQTRRHVLPHPERPVYSQSLRLKMR